MADAVAKVITIAKASLVYYDNILAVYMPQNPAHCRWTKHVELVIHLSRASSTQAAEGSSRTYTSLVHRSYEMGLPA